MFDGLVVDATMNSNRRTLLQAIINGINLYEENHKGEVHTNDILLAYTIRDQLTRFLDDKFTKCVENHNTMNVECIINLWESVTNESGAK